MGILVRALVFFVCLSGCGCYEETKKSYPNIALLKLLSNSKKYDGHLVEVSGYVKLDVELRLYLTGEHAEALDFESSIILALEDEIVYQYFLCNESFVSVTGIFYDSLPYSIISGISELVEMPERTNCFDANLK